jgi:hypothetical protein
MEQVMSLSGRERYRSDSGYDSRGQVPKCSACAPPGCLQHARTSASPCHPEGVLARLWRVRRTFASRGEIMFTQMTGWGRPWGAHMRKLVALVVLGVLVASGCGDDDSSDGDLTAFCDARDRVEQSDPFAFPDDRDAYEAEIDDMEAGVADARSNAPSEISDEVEALSQVMDETIAALRSLEDPSDEAEVEAALSALDNNDPSDTDLDAYLVENCDDRSSGGDSE